MTSESKQLKTTDDQGAEIETPSGFDPQLFPDFNADELYEKQCSIWFALNNYLFRLF